MEVLKVGVCESRHEMPVDTFIFPQVVDPLNVDKLEKEAELKLASLLRIMTVQQLDTKSLKGTGITLHIYVTGLTVATLAIINAARKLFNNIVCYHYDYNSNTYYPQEIR